MPLTLDHLVLSVLFLSMLVVMAICHSAAWEAKIVISAYWVHHHQVCILYWSYISCTYAVSHQNGREFSYNLFGIYIYMTVMTGLQDRAYWRVSDYWVVYDSREEGKVYNVVCDRLWISTNQLSILIYLTCFLGNLEFSPASAACIRLWRVIQGGRLVYTYVCVDIASLML